MTEAVIVSTARTPLCKSWKGAFNMTHGATMGGHALQAAMERARIDPGEIEDVIMGCANPEGATGRNIARQIAHPRRLSGDHAGHDRQPLLFVGPADDRDRRAAGDDRRRRHLRRRRRRVDLVRAERDEQAHAERDWILANKPELYWPMLQTAENVAERYGISARAAGPVRRAQPAARRRGARRRQIRRRDRADDHDDEGRGQSDRRGVDQEVTVVAGRGHPRRHDLRGRVEDQAGDRRRRDLRRQRQPVLRRRRRLRGDEREPPPRRA